MTKKTNLINPKPRLKEFTGSMLKKTLIKRLSHNNINEQKILFFKKKSLFFDIISKMKIKSKIIIPKFNMPVPIKKSIGSRHSNIIAQNWR